MYIRLTYLASYDYRKFDFCVCTCSIDCECGTVFDYMFHLDGTVEVRVSASGYLQGAYYDGDGKQDTYGTKIWETTSLCLNDSFLTVSD